MFKLAEYKELIMCENWFEESQTAKTTSSYSRFISYKNC